MDAFFGGLYKDLYRVSSKVTNPLFICTGTFLLLLGIVLFLLWPTNVVIKHFIGVALLILAWTLALNYKPIDMMGVRSDPSIDPQNEIGSVVSNYLLLITRLMVVCVVLYYSIKICVIVVESFKDGAVIEYFCARNLPFVAKFYWALLIWVPFLFLGWTILGVSKALKRLLPSWDIVSAPTDEYVNFVRKYLQDNKDKIPLLLISTIFPPINETYFTTFPLETSMLFSYQKWIDLVHDNISEKNISDFYGLLDFSKSWMTHGAAFVTGLVVVIVYFYAILNKQSCIDISTIITNTNQIAFATLLTFYLVTYLVRNMNNESK